jgi:hypothetical protein
MDGLVIGILVIFVIIKYYDSGCIENKIEKNTKIKVYGSEHGSGMAWGRHP